MTQTEIASFFKRFHNSIEKEEANSIGLVKGCDGLALCYYFLYLLVNDSFFENAFLSNRLSSLKNAQAFDPSVASGFSSFIITSKICDKIPFLNNEQEAKILDSLSKELDNMLSDDNYEYFTGASGLFLALLHDNNYDDCALRFCKRLEEITENNFDFSVYSTHNSDRTIFIGAPHGITGILLCLLKVQGIHSSYYYRVIRHLTNTLICHIFIDKNNVSHFPHSISGSLINNKEYLSWVCWGFGDLMSSYAIVKAAIVLGDDKLYDWGSNLLLSTINREDYNNDRVDLCCGLSSIPLVYKSAYKMSGEKSYINAYEQWSKRFEIRYKEFLNGSSSIKTSIYNPSLFYGISGATLAFLHQHENIEKWDSILLL